MLDVLIKNGVVVDGSGRPRRRADVGVLDGRIVAVDPTRDREARKAAGTVVDADGLVVAPGFVDVHTHYDAQLSWDPTASPSPLHGVTTAIGGNCGFTLAPLGPADAGYIRRMMARVEGMSLVALEQGATWDWTSFGDWLSQIDRPLGLNAGFLVGHNALRRTAMGADSVAGAASPHHLMTMQQLLHDALRAGGLGLSTTRAPVHNDDAGRPVPSRHATDGELLSLARVLSEHPGTFIQMTLAGSGSRFSAAEIDLMAEMSRVSGRPLSWSSLTTRAVDRDRTNHQLSASEVARARGGRVLAVAPAEDKRFRLSFITAFVLDALPGWGEVMQLPLAARAQALLDPDVRTRLAAGAASPEAANLGTLVTWHRMEILDTYAAENAGLRGRCVGDIARERGVTAMDALLDIVVADDLRTGVLTPAFSDQPDLWALRAEIWKDPRVVVGASDAGAHADMICGASFATSFLREAVRTRQLLTLEEAVRMLTTEAAALYGLRDRGRVAEGCAADIVILDPDAIGTDELELRHDLPGGADRLYLEATGIERVFVNGRATVEGRRFTGDLPGRVLRSGQDTRTVKP